MKKLGLHKKMPHSGEKLHLAAQAHVHSVSTKAGEGGKPEHRIELLLKKMSVEGGKKSTLEEREAKQLKGAKQAIDKALNAESGEDDGADNE